MPRAANQYNGSLIRPALCPNSNKAAVLNLEKLIEGRPSICADTVLPPNSFCKSLTTVDTLALKGVEMKISYK